MGNSGSGSLEINLQNVDNDQVHESPVSGNRVVEDEFEHLKMPRYFNSKKS